MLQWWKIQAPLDLFNIFFPPFLSGYYSVPPTGSNAISGTLLRPWHSTSNTHLLYGATGRLTHTSSLPGNCTHTCPDWQINVRDECKQTRPEASLIAITPLLYRLVKRFTVWETIFPTGLQVPPHCLQRRSKSCVLNSSKPLSDQPHPCLNIAVLQPKKMPPISHQRVLSAPPRCTWV